ncbi:MAG TPA: fused MFS/spermidine synthase [Gemmatimonadaceae bacterium]|nr:fused MFS/spermidine synthase [Gemmatimonadaceae bacterium]
MSAAPPATLAATIDAPASRARDALLLAGYTVTLFLNAALLFAVQPMFSKMALPLLGGTPSVWNTCMLVFQALLLGGYLYAYLTTRWLGTRAQVTLHVALLVASLALLPVGIPASWTPGGAAPLLWLVRLLLVGLGLPFFLLSTGAPLLQQWFSRTGHPAAGNPYFLYAASNAGSMLALLAYPLVVEPLLGVTRQSRLWSVLYVAVVALVALCGVGAARRARPRGRASAAASSESVDGTLAISGRAAWPERLWWTLLAFAPSSLLLGVTTYLSTDMAAFPLLWVVPLAIYLLTFVLVFARRQVIPHALVLRLHPILLLPLVVSLFAGRSTDLRLMAPLHLLLFFVTAMVCHGELARLRPPAARLTEFYLWLSVGGVLGGIFNVLLAPVLFDRVLEYQLVLAAACALRPWPAAGRRDWRQLRRDAFIPLGLFVLVVTVLQDGFEGASQTVTAYGVPVLGGLAAFACLFLVRRPLRFALGVLAVLMAGIVGRANGRPPLLAVRSFFGVYGVRDAGGGFYVLYNGTTLHGAQDRRAGHTREPLTYYRVRGPLGDLFSVKRLERRPLRVGVVGLGAGSVACYARPGDRWTFYEIDPAIERIARDRRYFTYLSECTPDARVVLGDARLSLAHDSDERYDILVLDAFSSDAIPVHLLTREALAVYRAHLAPGGIIAVHVSNRYLDLRPVVGNLAADAGMVALLGEERRLSAADRARLHTASVWIAVAERRAPLEALSVRQPRWGALEWDAGAGVWTDDYSNVLGALVKR